MSNVLNTAVNINADTNDSGDKKRQHDEENGNLNKKQKHNDGEEDLITDEKSAEQVSWGTKEKKNRLGLWWSDVSKVESKVIMI